MNDNSEQGAAASPPDWHPIRLKDDRPLTEEEAAIAAFRMGEGIPLRGTVWRVAQVNLKTVVLVPLGPTKRNKQN